MNQGRFGNQFVGFNLNNSNGGRTSYITFNYTRRNTYDETQTNRAFSPDSLLSQRAFTTFPANIFYTGYGLGFEPTKKWVINFDGRVSWSQSQSMADNLNQINRVRDGFLVTQNDNFLTNKTSSLGLTQDFTAKYKIDSLGSDWTTELSYNLSTSTGTQNFSTIFVKPTRQTLVGNGDIENQRQYFTARTDLKWMLAHKITFETGFKTSFQHFRNQTQYFNQVGDARRTDVFRTRTFDYDEQIHAAYLQASKSFGGFVLKAGLRLENTNMAGKQRVPSDTSFNIRRTDLFPYIYLSRNVAKIAGYQLRSYLVYRRSITRPVYEYLNPFPRYLDQYLYETGNPTLRPQFTQNIEFNVSVMDMPILAVGRNYTQDIFTNVVYQDAQNPSIAVRTYDNLGKNQETYFRILVGIPPGGRYFGVVGTQFNHNRYEGIYEGKPLLFERGSWSIFSFHSLKIDNRSTLNLNGFIRLKGQLQFYELSNFGNLNLSINRVFLDRKLTVTFSANDLFFTNNNRFVINQGSIAASGFRQSDTRRFGINLRYNFGIRKREERTNMMNFENLEKSTN
jgi:hypothetical protein